jgi:hypothetical protein
MGNAESNAIKDSNLEGALETNNQNYVQAVQKLTKLLDEQCQDGICSDEDEAIKGLREVIGNIMKQVDNLKTSGLEVPEFKGELSTFEANTCKDVKAAKTYLESLLKHRNAIVQYQKDIAAYEKLAEFNGKVVDTVEMMEGNLKSVYSKMERIKEEKQGGSDQLPSIERTIRKLKMVLDSGLNTPEIARIREKLFNKMKKQYGGIADMHLEQDGGKKINRKKAARKKRKEKKKKKRKKKKKQEDNDNSETSEDNDNSETSEDNDNSETEDNDNSDTEDNDTTLVEQTALVPIEKQNVGDEDSNTTLVEQTALVPIEKQNVGDEDSNTTLVEQTALVTSDSDGKETKTSTEINYDEIRDIFNIIDRDSDEELTIIELIQALRKSEKVADMLELSQKITEGKTRNKFEEWFQDADKNDDRKLSWDEFKNKLADQIEDTDDDDSMALEDKPLQIEDKEDDTYKPETKTVPKVNYKTVLKVLEMNRALRQPNKDYKAEKISARQSTNVENIKKHLDDNKKNFTALLTQLKKLLTDTCDKNGKNCTNAQDSIKVIVETINGLYQTTNALEQSLKDRPLPKLDVKANDLKAVDCKTVDKYEVEKIVNGVSEQVKQIVEYQKVSTENAIIVNAKTQIKLLLDDMITEWSKLTSKYNKFLQGENGTFEANFKKKQEGGFTEHPIDRNIRHLKMVVDSGMNTPEVVAVREKLMRRAYNRMSMFSLLPYKLG